MVYLKNVITGVLSLCVCVSVQADYVYTTLDVPGATSTYVRDIDGSNIVGFYTNSDGLGYHGFSYDGTTYTTIEVPGANETYAYGSDGGNIVGSYEDGSYNDHGFSYDGTTYTTLDGPGAISTYANGIDGGNIVGWYNDAGGVHGFIYDGSTYTTLDVPTADRTYARGLDGSYHHITASSPPSPNPRHCRFWLWAC